MTNRYPAIGNLSCFVIVVFVVDKRMEGRKEVRKKEYGEKGEIRNYMKGFI